MLAGPQLVLPHVHADGGVGPQFLPQQPQQPAGEHAAFFDRILPAQLLGPALTKLRQPGGAVSGQVPLQQLLKTASLNVSCWIVVLALSGSVVVINEFSKLFNPINRR